MNRILLAALFVGTIQGPAWAQKSTSSSEKQTLRSEIPTVERTETIIYKKRVKEKRRGNASLTTSSTSESPTAAVPEAPFIEQPSSASSPRSSQPMINSSVSPAAGETAIQSELRALRTMVEAQGLRIDSIQHEVVNGKGRAVKADGPNRLKLGRAIKRDNVSIGIYAGPNLSKYSTDQDSLDSKARVGYQLGLYVRGGGRLFGQIGAEYLGISSKLYSKDDKGTSLNQINSTINTHYLQIPVQIGFRPAMTPSKRTGIRIQAGAELSYLLNSGKNDLSVTKEDYNKTVINGVGGIGFDLGPLTLDISYHRGIRDVYKETNAKLRMVSASLGFKF